MIKEGVATEEKLPVLRTLEEAKALKDLLVAAIQKLQLDLSNKNKMFGNGKRMVGSDYQAWRIETITKITEVQRQMKYVKGWISKQSQAKPPEHPKPAPTRIEALEKLHRRVKSYAEAQKEGARPIEEMKARWQDILQSLGEIEKGV